MPPAVAAALVVPEPLPPAIAAMLARSPSAAEPRGGARAAVAAENGEALAKGIGADAVAPRSPLRPYELVELGGNL